MLGSIGILTVAILIALFEVPSLIKHKLIKDLIVFCLLLLISTTLIIFRVMDFPLANPMNMLNAIFAPVSHWVDQLLK